MFIDSYLHWFGQTHLKYDLLKPIMAIQVTFDYSIKHIGNIERFLLWFEQRPSGGCAFAPCTWIWHYTVGETCTFDTQSWDHMHKIELQRILWISKMGAESTQSWVTGYSFMSCFSSFSFMRYPCDGHGTDWWMIPPPGAQDRKWNIVEFTDTI